MTVTGRKEEREAEIEGVGGVDSETERERREGRERKREEGKTKRQTPQKLYFTRIVV